MISKVDILVNLQRTELKINNRIPSQPESNLINLAERYFDRFAQNQLKITYILWTEALSFEELESREAIEADCLEFWVDQQLKEREEVMMDHLGKLLYLPIQAVAIEDQKNQLLKARFVTEKELDIHDWKVKNTWFGNGGSLVNKGQKLIRSNVYYQGDTLIFASSINSPDQIVFHNPLKSLGVWVTDESKRYLMMVSPTEETVTLLDTESMVKQSFTQLRFLEQIKTA